MVLKKIFFCLLVSVVFLLGLSECQTNSSKPYKVVCYLGSWANYRNGRGRFVIEDIDPFLCTHLVYGFAKLGNDNRIKSYDPYLDLKENWGLGAYERFNDLKQNNTELKTLLAIGGWNEGSTKYSKMAANPQSRKIFTSSCIDFLERYNFNGLDLDWEYPANRGGSPDDKRNFVILLKEMKQAFVEHNLLLTAAVGAGKATIDSAYNVPAITRHLDFINLMAYDFHGSWETVTGLNAPLYAKPGESEDENTLNVKYAVNYWLKKGAPAKKIVLGMGLYGRSFTLRNARPHGVGAPATGKGTAGPYTREPGMLGYNEICSMLDSDHSWQVIFDNDQKTPYAFKDRQWVGFDNVESIDLKVELIKTKKLAGGMVWSLETDDFRNHCGDGPYPLLTAIAKELNGLERPTTTATAPTTTTTTTAPTEPTTSTASTSVNKREEPSTEIGEITESTSAPIPPKDTSLSVDHCTKEGYFRNPEDCAKFYRCVEMQPSRFSIFNFSCGDGTVFSESEEVCVHRSGVPECNNES